MSLPKPANIHGLANALPPPVTQSGAVADHDGSASQSALDELANGIAELKALNAPEADAVVMLVEAMSTPQWRTNRAQAWANLEVALAQTASPAGQKLVAQMRAVLGRT